ncbi:hypothetical protein D3C86_1159940 [compost metagenome]
MKVHIRTVKQRIAFRQHGNIAPGLEMHGNILRRLIEKGDDRIAIIAAVFVAFDGYRIDQRHFQRTGANEGFDNATTVTAATLFAEEGEHIGIFDGTNGFQRQKFGITGAGADANEFTSGVFKKSRAHRPALATALMAAAVIAEPPMRPLTMA